MTLYISNNMSDVLHLKFQPDFLNRVFSISGKQYESRDEPYKPGTPLYYDSVDFPGKEDSAETDNFIEFSTYMSASGKNNQYGDIIKTGADGAAIFFCRQKIHREGSENRTLFNAHQRIGISILKGQYFDSSSTSGCSPDIVIRLWGDKTSDDFTLGGLKIRRHSPPSLLQKLDKRLSLIEHGYHKRWKIHDTNREVDISNEPNMKRGLLLAFRCAQSVLASEPIKYEAKLAQIEEETPDKINQAFERDLGHLRR